MPLDQIRSSLLATPNLRPTFDMSVTTTQHRPARHGTPTIARSSVEQTSHILNRMLEIGITPLRLHTIPVDSMRHYKSTAQEKEEAEEYISTT